jgi:hypothetical protein
MFPNADDVMFPFIIGYVSIYYCSLGSLFSKGAGRFGMGQGACASFYHHLHDNGFKVGEEFSWKLAQVTSGRALALDDSHPPRWRLHLDRLDRSLEVDRLLLEGFERLACNERKGVRKNISKLAVFLDKHLPFPTSEAEDRVQAATMSAPENDSPVVLTPDKPQGRGESVGGRGRASSSQLRVRLDNIKARKLKLSMPWRQACNDLIQSRRLLEEVSEKVNVLTETVVHLIEQALDKMEQMSMRKEDIEHCASGATVVYGTLEEIKQSLEQMLESQVDSEEVATDYHNPLVNEVLGLAKSF